MPVRRRAAGRAVPRAVVAPALAMVAAAATLGGCTNTSAPVNRTGYSGSATASESGGLQKITLVTGDDYRFHPATFFVHPGRLQVTLRNTGQGAPHNYQLTDVPADFVPLAAAGVTTQATFNAPNTPGKYQFICTIHVRQGQRGTMIVTKG